MPFGVFFFLYRIHAQYSFHSFIDIFIYLHWLTKRAAYIAFLFQFWNMDKLQEVCLDSASIHSLSPSIGNLKFLKHLSLNANALSDLPITLGFCQNLKTLSLDANSFSYIPSAILMINNFKHLSITGNPLVRCVQNVPLKELAAIPYTLASLPVISTSSVLLNYMDHWRLDSLVHKELEMLNYPMSKVALCGWCSQQILQGKFKLTHLKKKNFICTFSSQRTCC